MPVKKQRARAHFPGTFAVSRLKIPRKLPILLLVILFLAIPQISRAATGSRPENTLTVIERDRHSGGVIYRRQGAYFYGLAKSRRIVNAAAIQPGELIVKFKNRDRPLKAMGPIAAKTKILNRSLGLALVQLGQGRTYFQTWRKLAGNPDVAYAEPNYKVKAQRIPNDPYYAFQWGVRAISADKAWEKVNPVRRANVTIAIVDSGVNANHPELRDHLTAGYNFVANNQDTSDKFGHGTHVAGIAAAATGNGAGIAGVAGGSRIMPVKVLDDEGNGSDADIIRGIKYAVDHGAQVINLSLGGPDPSAGIQDAVDYAVDRGVSVVAAAGNESGPIDMPGNCRGVISVGAVDPNEQSASYSNFGPRLDVVAPGTGILSTYLGNGNSSSFTYLSGTSMAAPFVTGVVALLKAAAPDLAPAAVTEILHKSATDLGPAGFDEHYGYGLINAAKAVDLAYETSFKNIPPNRFGLM